MKKYATIEKQIRKCIQCGSCRVDCPTGQDVGWISCSPRAKVLFARDYLLGRWPSKVKMNKEFAERLFQCTLCGRCGVECITEIEFPEIWFDMREMVNDAGIKLPIVETVAGIISGKKNVADQPNDDRPNWLKRAKLSFDPTKVEKTDVVYFVGCMSSFYPQSQSMARAFAQILDAAGIKFAIMGSDEFCCGFPMLSTGKVKEAKDLMNHNLEVVKKFGAKNLVATCPACTSMWKKDYPHLSGKPNDFVVMHATQFVLQLLKDKKLKFGETKPITVTFHDGCDLGRNGGVYEEPRDILKMLPNVTFIEHPESKDESNCCGAGGDLLMTNPEMADRIGQKRASALCQTAPVAVTCCPSCKKHLKDTAKHAGVQLDTKDLLEMVAEMLEKPASVTKEGSPAPETAPPPQP